MQKIFTSKDSEPIWLQQTGSLMVGIILSILDWASRYECSNTIQATTFSLYKVLSKKSTVTLLFITEIRRLTFYL